MTDPKAVKSADAFIKWWEALEVDIAAEGLSADIVTFHLSINRSPSRSILAADLQNMAKLAASLINSQPDLQPDPQVNPHKPNGPRDYP